MGCMTVPADRIYFVRRIDPPKTLDDHRVELAETRAGSLLDGFYVGKRGKRRPLVCLTMHDDSGRCPVFASSAEAHEVTGIADQLIRRAAEGKYSAGGHRFLYLDKLPRGLADSSKYFTFKGRPPRRQIVWLSRHDAHGRHPVFESALEAERRTGVQNQRIIESAQLGCVRSGHRFAFLDDFVRSGAVAAVTLRAKG